MLALYISDVDRTNEAITIDSNLISYPNQQKTIYIMFDLVITQLMNKLGVSRFYI